MLLKQGFEMKIWMWEDGKTNNWNCFLMNCKLIRCNWNVSANLFPLMYKSAQGRCNWTVLLHNLEALVCVCVCVFVTSLTWYCCLHAHTHSLAHTSGSVKRVTRIPQVFPKCRKILSIFTHCHVVPNLYESFLWKQIFWTNFFLKSFFCLLKLHLSD